MTTTMAPNSKAMLTVKEAAALIGVHGNTLRRWTDAGLIRSYRLGPGQHRRYRPEDVANLIASGMQEQG